MIEGDFAQPAEDYEVRVGYLFVRVQGENRAAAIRRARQRLCHEMPRMWDVIQGLADSKFEVIKQSAN